MGTVADVKTQFEAVGSWSNNEDLLDRLNAVITRYSSDQDKLSRDDIDEVNAVVAESDRRARNLEQPVASFERIKVLAGGTPTPRPQSPTPIQSGGGTDELVAEPKVNPAFAEVGRAFDAIRQQALAVGNAGAVYIKTEHDRIKGNVELMLGGTLRDADAKVEPYRKQIADLEAQVALETRKTVVADGLASLQRDLAELDDAGVNDTAAEVGELLGQIRNQNFTLPTVERLEREYAALAQSLEDAKAARMNAARTEVAALNTALSQINPSPDRYIADAREAVAKRAEAALQQGFSKSALQTVAKAVEDFRKQMAAYEKKVETLTALQALAARVRTLSASCGSHHQDEYDRIEGNIRSVMAGSYSNEDKILADAVTAMAELEDELARSQDALDLIADLETRQSRVATFASSCGEHHQKEFDRIKGNIGTLKTGRNTDHGARLETYRTDIANLDARIALSQRKLDVRDALTRMKAEVDELNVRTVTLEHQDLEARVDANLDRNVAADWVKANLEDALAQLKADIPRQRLTKTKAAVTGDFEALKSKGAAEKLKMLEVIREGGSPLTPEQKALQRTLYKSMQLDPGFEAHEAGIRETVRGRVKDRLLGDPSAKATIKSWDEAYATDEKKTAARTKMNVPAINWDNWESDPNLDAGVKADLKAKLAVAQAVLEEQCAVRGMPVPPIRFTKPSAPEPVPGEPGATTTKKGHFSPSKGAIYLNPDPAGAMSDFPDLVDTIIHENSHNYQNDLVKKLEDPAFASDPRHDQALLFKANSEPDGYVEPGDGTTATDKFNYYKKQPLEEHAWKAGGEAKIEAVKWQDMARA